MHVRRCRTQCQGTLKMKCHPRRSYCRSNGSRASAYSSSKEHASAQGQVPPHARGEKLACFASGTTLSPRHRTCTDGMYSGRGRCFSAASAAAKDIREAPHLTCPIGNGGAVVLEQRFVHLLPPERKLHIRPFQLHGISLRPLTLGSDAIDLWICAIDLDGSHPQQRTRR
jgi:hypothetical protein